MCGVISGDYGGVFGLQQPRRVFGDWAGLRCLLVVLFRVQRAFSSFSVRTLTYNKKRIRGAPLCDVSNIK